MSKLILLTLIFSLGAPALEPSTWKQVKGEEVELGPYHFLFQLETQPDGNLTYLNSIRFKNLTTGQEQRFKTLDVNASENGANFELFTVNLRHAQPDLALHAFDSPQAGPSYIYFVWNKTLKKIVRSTSTIPRLELVNGSYRTAVQRVEFEFSNGQYREK